MLIKQPGRNARLYTKGTRSLASTSDSPAVMECCGILLLSQDCLKPDDLGFVAVKMVEEASF